MFQGHRKKLSSTFEKSSKTISKFLEVIISSIIFADADTDSCEDINDEGFEFVGQNIADYLYNLQELSLDFS